ncbi:hypothetical protein SNOG_15487 [Parastagonospora nodorum SN15]|uniref:Uncharacterized protein n=1 Tax=Phaeosphaeria nodorum (strain SN15 / ATCC MYA-4574 / FGSC 10173) TaxID=321614 RepID=Q0TYF5_PHANO|nr:hypothetical protein SNOG_15487 [Parastagonospora nodorum SN15]EAT77152.2 hypothetical protein SNOG_15487 [Parastagonospora nodorum SN15]
MVQHGLLPKPLPSDLLTVGQLLTHPLHPEPHTKKSTISTTTTSNLRYKDVFSVDSEGRFITNYGAKFDLGRIFRQPNLLTVRAEQMIQRTSQSKAQAFQAVCNDPEARTWISEQVKAGKPLYVVLGITELKNASFKRAKLHDAGASNRLNETPLENDAKVPKSIRARADASLGGIGSAPTISGVFGMDVRHVQARITTPAEPHRLEDIGYHWYYYDVPGSSSKEQLIVGLGEQLKGQRASSDARLERGRSWMLRVLLRAQCCDPARQHYAGARLLHTQECCAHSKPDFNLADEIYDIHETA